MYCLFSFIYDLYACFDVILNVISSDTVILFISGSGSRTAGENQADSFVCWFGRGSVISL